MRDGRGQERGLNGRTTRRAFLIAGLATTVVTACGGSGSRSSSGSVAATGATTTAAAGPRSGGTLRVGIVGSGNDIVDGQYIVAKPDIARLVTGWESLATYDENFEVVVGDGLAEEITTVAADEYVIRVHQGIEFHNAKTLGADDVAYSFRRAIDPTLGINPALRNVLSPSGISIVDERTVRVRLVRPDVTFVETLAQYFLGIVPDGYSRDDAVQVGTGAFALDSFTPGESSRHLRHRNYWRADPYLDAVEIIDLADPTALVNALRADQLDCAVDIPYAVADTLGEESGIELLESEGGAWLGITMAVDHPPFDDERVRQAFRLMVDRDEVVARVFAGHGRVANDMYAPLDPCTPDLPQRTQDIERAKSLLRDAGHESLQITLYAPNDVGGLADLATVFADHAADAGVSVDVQILPGAEYWGEDYLDRTFATAYWGTRSYLPQVPLSSLHDAVHAETHWPPAGSDFAATYERAVAETDPAERCEIVGKMQQEEHDAGGYIIPAFVNFVDAHRAGVHGFVARPNVINLDHYGRGFANVWLD